MTIAFRPNELPALRRARVIAEFQASIADAPPRFQVGDVITYEDSEGWHRVVTILLTTSCGGAVAMVYDGLPHYEAIELKDLDCLRVLKIDRMGPHDVASYLTMMNQADEAEELELAA
jgi:hypothetical protein